VGGDRFAGNVVVLPEGLYFGRVAEVDLVPVLDDYFDGRIHLPRYRGRSVYTFAVQAAESALREAHGLTGIDDLALERVERRGEGWTVHLRSPAGSQKVDVEAELAAEPVYLTCDSAMPQRPRRFTAWVR
jgi:hypothetical protein